MIHFFVDRDGMHGVRNYLAGRGVPLCGRLLPTSYDRLLQQTSIPTGSAIFAAIDQIGPRERAAGSALYKSLQAVAGARVLNDPRQVLCRFDLLQALHDDGINTFRAIRATTPFRDLRYPVFIREEHRHNGALTEPLADTIAVERALALLAIQGYRRQDLLIIEFCDTQGADGLYRKYSAFRVGDRLLPRYVNVSRNWVNKHGSSVLDESTIREEREYLESHPHEAMLWNIFRRANVEFGRIDYALKRGQLQVWEINTNPTLSGNPTRRKSPREEQHAASIEAVRQIFHSQFLRALELLDSGPSSGTLPITIGAEAQRAIAAERRARRQAGARRRLTFSIMESRPLQRARGVLSPLVSGITQLVAHWRARRHAL